MYIHIKRKTNEQYQAYMLCFVFGFNMLMLTFNNLMRLVIGNTYYIDTILMFGCYIFVFIHTLKRIIKSLKFKYLLFLLIMIFLPIFTCSNDSIIQKILSEQLPYCVIAFMICISIVDYELTWKVLYKFAWLMLIISLFDCLSYRHRYLLG